MRVRFDAGIDAQQHVDRPHVVRQRDDRRQALEFFAVVDDDAADPAGSGRRQLVAGLAASVQEHALRGKAGALRRE